MGFLFRSRGDGGQQPVQGGDRRRGTVVSAARSTFARAPWKRIAGDIGDLAPARSGSPWKLSALVPITITLMFAATAAAQESADVLGAPAPAAAAIAEGADDTPTEAVDGPIPPPPAAPGNYREVPDGGSGYPAPATSAGFGNDELGGARIPSRMATRLRVLDSDFTALSSRGGNHIVDGVLSILTGGLAITLGVLFDDELISPYLYLYGGAGVVRGVLDLSLTPDPSELAIQFAHMPMGNMGEVVARLHFGEEGLASLASDTRLVRILDASLNIGVGVAVVPLYLGPNDFAITSPFDYFVLIGAGISIISGLINLLTRSEAERRWDAYEELDSRLSAEDGGRAANQTPSGDGPERLSYGLVPLPGGAAVAGAWVF